MMRFVLPAIVLSVGLHAGLLALTGAPGVVREGAQSRISSTVIVLEALPAPAASASAGAEEVAQQQPLDAEEVTAETLPDEQASEPQPVEPVEDAKTEEAVPEADVAAEVPAPEPQQVVEPEQVIEPPEVVEPVQVVELPPEPMVRPKPEPAPGVDTDAFVPIPKPKPEVPADFARQQGSTEQPSSQELKAKPVVKSRPRKTTVRKTVSGKAKQKPAKTSKSGRTGKNKAQARAGSAGRSGGASAGEKAAYARRVLAHIQRYKSFPSGAHAGKVSLSVRIAASGALLSASVRRSSGHRVLDKAALATARRASPYPKPPGGRRFSFTVTLRYVR